MVRLAVCYEDERPEGARSAPPALGLVHTEQRTQTLTVQLEDSRRRASRCRRGTITRARLLDGQVQRGGFRGHWYLLTFTYRNGADWEPCDIKGWLKATRMQFQRRGATLHYVWTAELQKRGAIHYHAVVWVPRGHFIRKPDQCGLWPKGSTQIAKARNAVGYLAKYAGKGIGVQCHADGREIRFPKGARIQGAGGLGAPERSEARWWMAPRWLRDEVGGMVDVRKVPWRLAQRVDRGGDPVSVGIYRIHRGFRRGALSGTKERRQWLSLFSSVAA